MAKGGNLLLFAQLSSTFGTQEGKEKEKGKRKEEKGKRNGKGKRKEKGRKGKGKKGRKKSKEPRVFSYRILRACLEPQEVLAWNRKINPFPPQLIG